MIQKWSRRPKLLRDDDPRRDELLRLARGRHRSIKSTPERPAKWSPRQVPDPDHGNNPFTNHGAWELIASKIENGHQIEITELRRPKGATGYVMKIHLESSTRPLYVKLEMCRGWIHGRSFHISDR